MMVVLAAQKSVVAVAVLLKSGQMEQDLRAQMAGTVQQALILGLL